MSTTAQALLAAGDAHGALELLQRDVREHAADVKLRVFLFQLLCVHGQWQRALNQLQVCGGLDAGTLPMVNTYREAVACEAVREGVFEGRTVPMVFGRLRPWIAALVQALQADAAGDAALAGRLRADALDAAPATPGAMDGQAFDWIADADSRLGPVLEVVIEGRYGWLPFDDVARLVVETPVDLRDLVWASAQVTFAGGAHAVALLPSRYAGSGAEPDAALQLARLTEWREIGPEQFRGVGQRVLATSTGDAGLLQVREVVLRPAGDGGAGE